MKKEELIELIDTHLKSYVDIFKRHLHASDDMEARSHKVMLDNQRKSLEELAKMYRKQLENEEEYD